MSVIMLIVIPGSVAAVDMGCDSGAYCADLTRQLVILLIVMRLGIVLVVLPVAEVLQLVMLPVFGLLLLMFLSVVLRLVLVLLIVILLMFSVQAHKEDHRSEQNDFD